MNNVPIRFYLRKAAGNSGWRPKLALAGSFWSSAKDMVNFSTKRINFPEGKRYEHLVEIIIDLADMGCTEDEVKVPFEFQFNANSMLR